MKQAEGHATTGFHKSMNSRNLAYLNYSKVSRMKVEGRGNFYKLNKKHFRQSNSEDPEQTFNELHPKKKKKHLMRPMCYHSTEANNFNLVFT